MAFDTKTRKKQAGRTSPAAAKRTAPTVGKHAKKPDTLWGAIGNAAQNTNDWFRRRPHERYPLLVIGGTYGTGLALHAIHASPNGVVAGALVSMIGIVGASRKIKDGSRAFKTITMSAAAEIWVAVADQTGAIGPHGAMTLGFGVLSSVGYYLYRRDDVT